MDWKKYEHNSVFTTEDYKQFIDTFFNKSLIEMGIKERMVWNYLNECYRVKLGRPNTPSIIGTPSVILEKETKNNVYIENLMKEFMKIFGFDEDIVRKTIESWLRHNGFSMYDIDHIWFSPLQKWEKSINRIRNDLKLSYNRALLEVSNIPIYITNIV